MSVSLVTYSDVPTTATAPLYLDWRNEPTTVPPEVYFTSVAWFDSMVYTNPVASTAM